MAIKSEVVVDVGELIEIICANGGCMESETVLAQAIANSKEVIKLKENDNEGN